MPADTYDGPVGFGSDGVHYPADEEGHLDTSRPLRHVDGATYRDADKGEPLHQDVHQSTETIIYPGVTAVAQVGQDSYPVGIHVVSYEEGVYFILDEDGTVHREHPLTWDGETMTFRATGGGA